MYFIYKNKKNEISNRLIFRTFFIFSLTVLSTYTIYWGIYDTLLSSSNKTEKGSQVMEAATTSKDLEIGLQEGNKAPNFALKSLDGQEIKLSDMVGKNVILNFWATWCPPCKAEMPHMQGFYEEQKNNQVTF